MSQTLHADLQTLMLENFREDEPGGSLLVLKNDSIVFSQGYGIADLASGEKINAETVFNIGSISKTFVAMGILILAERGQLSLMDPVTRYFAFDHPEVVNEITIKHLLTHTSGLPDLRDVQNNREFYLTARDQENFSPLLSCDQLNFIPGSQFQYSNPAYNGLALIIEQVTGRKWQEFIEENIFQKSGMTHSKITDGPHPETGVAHAYVLQNNHFVESDYGEFPTFAAAGNGGIWSSTIDLVRYYQALKAAKFLRDKSMLEEAQRPWYSANWSGSDHPFVGYGWWRGEKALFSGVTFAKDMIFHTGSQGGFRGYYVNIPEEQILIVALFNRPVDKSILKSVTAIIQQHRWLNH
ncbi:MAG: beta-lactamase family protein [Saprospiraceae bacterium]|nr:beta-lactamase family protein [Saprospiraceae bacterium]